MTVVHPSDPDLPFPGQVLDDRFELRSSIAEGGMGLVFRAYDRRAGHEIALKLLIPRYRGRPERELRLLREAELGQRTRHRHLVKYLEAGRLQENGWPFVVMELVDGHDLGIRLVEGPLPGRQAAVIVRQIAGAVRALHQAGIVHRDVTAMNVLVKDDRATLIDLSHAGDMTLPQVPRGQPGRLTRLNEVPGTHHYMSREQANADPADPSMDVYAFGVTLVHILTGRAPRGYGREEFIAMQQRGLIESPRIDPRIYASAPLPLIELAHDCVRQVAQERPTMDEIVERLDALLATMLVTTEPTHPHAAANDVGHVPERDPDAPRPRVRRPRPTPDPDQPTDEQAAPKPSPEASVTVRDEGRDSAPQPAAPQLGEQPSRQRRLLIVMGILLLVALCAIVLLLVMLSRERNLRRSEEPSAQPSAAVEPIEPTERIDAGRAKGGAGAVEEPTMPAVEPRPTAPSEPAVGLGVEPSESGTDVESSEDGVDVESSEDGVDIEPKDAPREDARADEPERTKKKPSRSRTPPPEEPRACDDVHGQAQAAARERDWSKVLSLTRPSPCWEDGAARVRLRAGALAQLKRYSECAELADRTKDPETQRIARSCAAAIETSNP